MGKKAHRRGRSVSEMFPYNERNFIKADEVNYLNEPSGNIFLFTPPFNFFARMRVR